MYSGTQTIPATHLTAMRAAGKKLFMEQNPTASEKKVNQFVEELMTKEDRLWDVYQKFLIASGGQENIQVNTE